jgi:primosomal protein N' (replication factor Y) (superfamily II helicase)
MQVDVAIERPAFQSFTYAVPEPLQAAVAPGKRVLVPFGKRAEVGHVLCVRQEPAAPGVEIRPIDDVLDAEPVVGADVLGLLRWTAAYYLAPPGMVFRAAIPRGFNPHALVEAVPRLPMPEPMPELGEMERRLVLALSSGPQRVDRLSETLGSKGLYRALDRLEDLDLVELRRRVAQRREQRPADAVLQIAWSQERFAAEKEEAGKRRARRKVEVLSWLERASEGLVSLAALRSSFGQYGTRLLSELLEQGAVVEDRLALPLHHGPLEAPLVLTAEQQVVLARLERAMHDEEFLPLLLQGVTGSGKTEVYLQAASRVVERGKSVLFLVPEIGLTPLLLTRVRRRFGARVAVLHSALTEAERLLQWKRIRRGQVDLVVGARSAVFAPLPRLGLIVVDEEHDGSYKQSSGVPLYHGRDLAVVRARACRCPVVLGSATPTLETRHNAETGKYEMLRLTQRVEHQELPAVEVVDLRKDPERRKGAEGPVLSARLKEALASCLQADEQAILLLNRRGFSTVLLCTECGQSIGCKDCSVTMTYHAHGQKLACHLCGAEDRPPRVCPSCKSPVIEYRGTGTQRLEQELTSLFPGIRLGRMDRDTTRGRSGHERILSRFESGELQVLVGTQMLAKGHHFPNVTLVGIVGADQVFNLPDFRAGERAFQLFTQAAGRAGRSARGGTVLLETYRPEHPILQLCRKHDYEEFYRRELAYRRGFRLPPASHLVNVTLAAAEWPAASAAGSELARALRDALGEVADVLGPAMAPVARVKKLYRFHVLLRTQQPTRLVRELHRVLVDFRPKGGVRVTADVDPIAIL